MWHPGVRVRSDRTQTHTEASISAPAANCLLPTARCLLPQRFKHLFDVNEKQGSFYLQSKVRGR